MLLRKPITLKAARRFVAEHHRHNDPPHVWLFGTSVVLDGQVVGVGVAAKPKAAALDDGATVEITRCATVGVAAQPRSKNAASMIYGALCRASEALGYTSAITYTLTEEEAICVRAAGFELEAELAARDTWDTPSRPRVQRDLFGHERRPPGPKRRWRRWF